MPDLVANIPRHRGNRNKPDESRWRQQTLPAYRPLLGVRCAMPITLAGGLIFIALGVLLHLGVKSAKEVAIDYTNCTLSNGTRARDVSSPSEPCMYNITLDENFEGPVKFQYGLEHFFQNSRMYLKSRNDVQLFGEINSTEDCEPYAKSNETGQELSIVPCGSIANSMFNDTFKLYYLSVDSTLVEVPFSTENVTWKGERERKFKNPPHDPSKNETLCDAFAGTVKPPNWIQPICKLGSANTGYGLENIDFIIWMKPAALPKFRKNYRTLNRSSIFANGLIKGTYLLKINFNYPVKDFNGGKRFIIALDGIRGPKNNFLAIAYIAFGSFLILVSVLFFILHLRQRVHSD